MVMRLKLISMAVMFAITLVIPGSLYAQDSIRHNQQMKSRPSEEMAKNETAKMKEKLKLTDEQTQKVGDINLKYGKLMDDLRKPNSQATDRKASHEKMKELHEKKIAELKTILTPEQFEQFQKMHGVDKSNLLKNLDANV